MAKFERGDRVQHTILDVKGTVLEEAAEGAIFPEGGDLRVAWDSGSSITTLTLHCELLVDQTQPVEPAEEIDRLADGDDGGTHPCTGCNAAGGAECCFDEDYLAALKARDERHLNGFDIDEPTAEEYEAAARLFESPKLEAAIDRAIQAESMDPTDPRWLDPRRVAALSLATDSYFAQVRFGYAHTPDASHLLSIARFLLDEEFVVGTVNN